MGGSPDVEKKNGLPSPNYAFSIRSDTGVPFFTIEWTNVLE
jgi:hypothetical protein